MPAKLRGCRSSAGTSLEMRAFAPAQTPVRPHPPAVEISTLRAAAILLALPCAYFITAYAYLAIWHQRLWLGNTLIHENGRLTLTGSVFFFDHFIGVVPMVTFFALCTAGGFALGGSSPSISVRSRGRTLAVVLLLFSLLLVGFSFAASIQVAGWQRTIDYALQRIERDGLLSPGGTWNQLQLSNIPIALGAIALGSMLRLYSQHRKQGNLFRPGLICLSLAAALSLGIMLSGWAGWRMFLNPRWLGHSMREVATYPLTGIPTALACILLTSYYLCDSRTVRVRVHLWALLLLGASVTLVISQYLLLRGVDIMAVAQKPAFAPQGLSVAYLLFSHVFEHTLDFVLIAALTAGIYTLMLLYQPGPRKERELSGGAEGTW